MRDKEHTDMKVLIGIEKKSVKKEIIMLAAWLHEV